MKRQLARLGHWLVNRYDPPRPSTVPHRFFVGVSFYDGPAGGDARRAWEREVAKPAPSVGTLEFWDGDDCRGRYPA